ncbi:MAG: glycosyltransferase family 4 protein [Janthinobacterium lividum]
MQILVFSTVFYPVLGGIENLTLNLCKEFVKEGHEVKVITYQKQTDILENIDVFCMPGFAKTMQLFTWCNVYYMPNISLRGVWPLLFNPHKKWVVSQNDFSLSRKKNFLSLLKLFLIKFTSKNISVSKSVAASLHTSSKVIYNCYDDAVFTIQNSSPRTLNFVFVGRLVSQKGCDTLIRACAEINQPFQLTIVGDGPEMKRLKNLTKKLNLVDYVHFTGTLDSEQIAGILNQHKVLIIPSIRKEGFGIVVLEGMACGCQIIAADSGGLAEAVGQFGQLYLPGDVQQLNLLLKEALQNGHPNYNPTQLVGYLNNFRKHIVAQKYLSVFKQIP